MTENLDHPLTLQDSVELFLAEEEGSQSKEYRKEGSHSSDNGEKGKEEIEQQSNEKCQFLILIFAEPYEKALTGPSDNKDTTEIKVHEKYSQKEKG